VGATAKEVAKMHAKGAHVGAGLAADPKDAHVLFLVVLNKLKLVNVADAQFLLDGADKGRPLEAGSLQRVQRLPDLLRFVQLLVQLENSHILFACGLLSLDKARCVVAAGDEAACDFWVERARVTCLLNLKDLFDPGDDFVRRGVRGFVQVDDTVVLENVDGPLCGGVAAGQRCEVIGFDVHAVEVLHRES